MQPEYLASAHLACPSISRVIRNKKKIEFRSTTLPWFYHENKALKRILERLESRRDECKNDSVDSSRFSS